jgi:hypothetical protein
MQDDSHASWPRPPGPHPPAGTEFAGRPAGETRRERHHGRARRSRRRW